MVNSPRIMYIGRYYHRLEAKGRVSLPVKFREKLRSGGVITKELDGCLAIFDQESWSKKIQAIENLSFAKLAHRNYIRFLTNDAQELEIDGQGRIRIDEGLLERAGLTKEVVIVGTRDHVEVWDQAKYHEYMSHVEDGIEESAEGIDLEI